MSQSYSRGDDLDDSGGYNRPRRSSVETVTYLRGLPLDVKVSKQEIETFLEANSSKKGGKNQNMDNNENEDDDDDDFPQSLAAALSAIDEIRMEIASLAGDEFGSQCLEVLTHIAAPYSETAARILLAGCAGYHLHLATHRYGSHVIQTILQLAVSFNKSMISKGDLATYDEAPQFSNEIIDALPSLSDLIHGMVEELIPHAASLAVHVCGSHVMRTLLCVLGGVDLVSSSGPGGANVKVETGAVLRGRKKSKKKKKKKPMDDSTSAPHAGTMSIVYRVDSRIDASEYTPLLEELAKALMGKPSNQPGQLQQHSVHPSAGPLLIVLLRVLTYSTPSVKEEWEKIQHSDETNKVIADFRLGISAEEPTLAVNSLAYELVKRILCWQEGSTEQKDAGDIIYGLSGEARGSHLLETMLRLVPDEMYESIVKCGDFESPTALQEYIEHDVSNFVIQTLLTTVRNKEQAERMLKVMEKVISSGLAVDPNRKRRGILWRTVELSAKYRVGQESLLKAIRLGFLAINVATIDTTADSSGATDGKKKKQRKKASAIDIKDCVAQLINVKKPNEEGGRINLDAAGCRSVHHMLRFTPRLCEDVLNGIIEELEADDLVLVAKDGLGSRCIMDGILDGPVKTPVFGTAVKSLLNKLKGSWVSLATDRVGHHTVKKMFKALPKIDNKAKLVEELEDGGNRMNGNAMGRSVVETCFVEEYRENRKAWRKAVSKMMATEEKSVDDIVTETVEGTAEIKTKAKRKRKRKKASQESAEGGDAEDSENHPPTKKTTSSIGVDSIIQAISAGK